MTSVAALALRSAMAVPNRLWASYSRVPSACTAGSASRDSGQGALLQLIGSSCHAW
jgi:hypothetical protein